LKTTPAGCYLLVAKTAYPAIRTRCIGQVDIFQHAAFGSLSGAQLLGTLRPKGSACQHFGISEVEGWLAHLLRPSCRLL
jgi:hypothetical protein